MLKRITPEQALERALIHKASLQGGNTAGTSGMRKTRGSSTPPDLDNLGEYTSENINFKVGYNDDPNMYFYHKEDGSGLITPAVGSDDESSPFNPLLGYWDDPIDEGDDSMPPGLVDLLESYDREISWVVENESEIENEEGEVGEDDGEASENIDIGPLIECQWDQKNPYYNKMGFGTSKSYTGCGATAIAQILYYWGCQTNDYNNKLRKVGSKLIEGYKSTKTKTVDGKSVTFNYSIPKLESLPEFDYDNLIKVYKDKNWSTAQANAVSQLMLYCACAARSNFSPYGTGSNINTLVDVFKNYFGFSTEKLKKIKESEYKNKSDFINCLINEIKEGRPCLFNAQDSNGKGGHHFICDGYKSIDSTFHFNWGWNGNRDGWFTLTATKSSLNPGSYKFNTDKKAIIGIRPYSIEKGDVNQDGSISVPDVMAAVALFKGESVAPEIAELYKDGKYDKKLIKILDFDNDGVITTDDILTLVNRILG